MGGDWKAKRIDNPGYKGVWVHPRIANPEYEDDDTLYSYSDFGCIGFDLWQVKSGSIFSDILITDDEDAAKAAQESFATLAKKEADEKAAAEEAKKAEEEAKKAEEDAEDGNADADAA